MTLEEAAPEDLPELHRLVERAYRGETARSGWSHEADLLEGPRTSVDELASFVEDSTRHLLIWRPNDKICACVLLWNKGERLTYLGMLTVEPSLQGCGTGKILLAAAEDYARNRLGAARMEMQVFTPRRELIAFYERRGYQATGERRPFPYADWPQAGALRDDLEFVVLEKKL